MTAVKKRILVAVDFSECSAEALSVALSLAVPLGGRLIVVHAWQQPYRMGSDPVVVRPPGLAFDDYLREEAERQLARMLKAFPPPPGVLVDALVERGEPADVILRNVERGADLVVVGTHGRTGLMHALVGSVAEAVVRQCPVPVLTVHARPKAG